MKKTLIARFRYLWTWELINALIIFPFTLFSIQQNFQIGFFTILTTVVICTILIIGSTFSFLKYRDLVNTTNHIGKYKNVFRLLRWLIPTVLLILLLLYSQYGLIETGDWVLTIVLYTMAVLEYINYFHFQLMYDNKKDLKYLGKYKRLKQGLIAREFAW